MLHSIVERFLASGAWMDATAGLELLPTATREPLPPPKNNGESAQKPKKRPPQPPPEPKQWDGWD